MKYFIAISCFLSIVTFSSCKSDKKVEIKDGKIGVTDALDAAQAMSEGVKVASERLSFSFAPV